MGKVMVTLSIAIIRVSVMGIVMLVGQGLRQGIVA